MNLSLTDKSIVVGYLAVMLLLSFYLTIRLGRGLNLRHYFLANKSLPWWMVGISTLAVNVSAEHFVSMTNAAYHLGFILISYEWIAALTLIIVAKYWLPICFKRGIYTLPQLLQQRVNRKARTVMAGYWLVFYVLVALTGLFWIATTSLHMMTGLSYPWVLVILLFLSTLPVLSSGMRGLSWLDVFNVGLMVIAGGIITLCLLDQIALLLGTESIAQTLQSIYQQYPQKFELLVDSDHKFYHEMPKISVLIGGMWILNMHFWGLNQPNMQRMLSGKTLNDCQKGVLFAAGVKTILPVIIMLPGILVMVLAGSNLNSNINPSPAYNQLYQLLPVGIKGLAIVSIIAASLSSISSVALSASTLFTLDLYAANNSEQRTHSSLWVAKVAGILALCIGALLSVPLLSGWQQGFFLAQLLGGVLTPAILVIFISVFLFKATNLVSMVMPVVVSVLSAVGFNQFAAHVPFLHQIEITFLLCLMCSLAARWMSSNRQNVQLERGFVVEKTSTVFNLFASCLVLLILTGYWCFA